MAPVILPTCTTDPFLKNVLYCLLSCFGNPCLPLSLPAIFSANQHWSRTETQKSVGPTNTFCLPPAKLPANRIGIHRRRCLPHTKAKAQTDKLIRFKRLLCVPIMCRYMFEGSSNNKRYMAKWLERCIYCQSNPSIQTPLWLELVHGYSWVRY